jgi:2'-hydroxyisoflavone reductase
MKLLILGGTAFLGPHLVRAARARGHALTLFNRGQAAAAAPPPTDVETVLGDRDPTKGTGLATLGRGSWDAVIDTCGYVPRVVAASAAVLADHVGQYVFVSSRSVYCDMSQPGGDEGAPTATLEDPQTEEVSGRTYGALKASCERAAEAAMPGRVTAVRPGLIVGPGDPTDRFTYWLARMDRGGEMLAPGDRDAPVQFIDVRDLAEFVIRLIEAAQVGPFNALGPEAATSMAQVLEACRAATTSDVRLTWVSQEFLLWQGVQPWTELPLWVPDTPQNHGFARLSNAKARKAGLRFRPTVDTARDTLNWFKSKRPSDDLLRAGLAPERERAILDSWHRGEAPAPKESSTRRPSPTG